jgi:hypothetical protein
LLQRPSYLDLDWGEEVPDDCDMIQEKHDGCWAHAVLSRGMLTLFSRRGNVLGAWPQKGPDCQLVGEYMARTPRSSRKSSCGHLIVFDAVNAAGANLRALPYSARLEMAAHIVGQIGAWRINLVESHPIEDLPELWDMMHTEDGEGVVLRRSSDTWGETIYRIIRDAGAVPLATASI